MRVFALAMGGRSLASARRRLWDHAGWLEGEGFSLVIASLLPPDGAGGRWWRLARVAWLYPFWLLAAVRADVVLVQDSLALWPVALFRRLGRPRRLVFDFSNPVDGGEGGWRLWPRRAGFALMVRGADVVVAENHLYLERLRGKARCLHQFCSPVDIARHDRARLELSRSPARAAGVRPVRLCWTGSPGTFAFVQPLLPVLDEVAARRPLQLVLMGAPAGLGHRFRHLVPEWHEWEEEREFALLAGCEIGLLRLPEGAQGLYRGTGKLFSYLAAGLFPVASGRGLAGRILREAGVGIAVQGEDGWAEAIERACMADRAAAARRGRAYALRHFSYDAYRRHLAAVLRGRAEPAG